mgnify:CR=1 FL=1
MSTALYWRPCIQPSNQRLPTALKYVLGPRLFGHDGSLGGEATVGHELIPFLEGLEASGTLEVRTGARQLIDLIEKYERIVLELVS